MNFEFLCTPGPWPNRDSSFSDSTQRVLHLPPWSFGFDRTSTISRDPVQQEAQNATMRTHLITTDNYTHLYTYTLTHIYLVRGWGSNPQGVCVAATLLCFFPYTSLGCRQDREPVGRPPGQDRMRPFGIIGVVTRCIPARALGELAESGLTAPRHPQRDLGVPRMLTGAPNKVGGTSAARRPKEGVRRSVALDLVDRSDFPSPD